MRGRDFVSWHENETSTKLETLTEVLPSFATKFTNHFGMAKGDISRVKALAARVTGRGKAVRMAVGSAFKAGASKAEKGMVPALIVGGGVQTIGLALANAGKLSIPIMGYRVPIIGTLGSIVLALIGWTLRKRPIAKIFWTSATALAISQTVDLVKFGWRVTPPAGSPDKGVKVEEKK